MPDLRDLLRHGLGDVRPDPDALERTRERIRIRRRNRRAGAAGTALTLGLAAFVLVWTAFRPTSSPAPATRPADLIVFSAQAPSDLTPFIQVMDGDGSDVHRLAPGDDPALSADGTSIAFVRTTEVGTGIWVMKPDGSGQRQLTSNPHGMDESPTWSPNGTEIAIDRSTGLGTPRRIYVVKIDGTGLEPITDRDWDRFEPAWSPDGSQIAFVTAGPGTIESNGNPPQIWMMDADGSDQRQLTTLPFGAWRPAWSPDGSQIAFDGSDGAIYVMNADGSGLRKLGPSIGGFDPTWSPDGNRIAFTGGSDNDHRIFSMNLDGEDVDLLTEAPNATSATSPSWGPVPTLTPPSATQCVQATTSGDFDGDGTVDEAKVIAIVSGVVSCDRTGDVYSHLESQQIQVRFGSGQTLDQPLADCQPCLTGGLVFTATDLDGNGHDELAIDVGPGAATDYVEFYRMDSRGMRALLVAEPGDPPFIAPGPAILGGGFDSGLWSPIECRVAADGTRELISVHAENVTGPITGPWKVHTTTLVLTGNRLVVASTNDVESKNYFSNRPGVFRNGCS